MGRFALRQPAQAATTAVVLSRVTGIATHSAYVSEVYLSVTVATGSDQLVRVQLVTLTDDGAGGTSSGLMVSRDDGALDTYTGTYMVYDGAWTTEPTVGNVLKEFVANFSPGFHQVQWKPSSEQRLNAGTGVRWGLRIPAAPGSSVTIGSEMEWYQG